MTSELQYQPTRNRRNITPDNDNFSEGLLFIYGCHNSILTLHQLRPPILTKIMIPTWLYVRSERLVASPSHQRYVSTWAILMTVLTIIYTALRETLPQVQLIDQVQLGICLRLLHSPQNAVKGDLRKTFGNPTPLWVPCSTRPSSILDWLRRSALVGFLLSLTPLSCVLMGWRGAGGSGAASLASYFFFGGMLMTLGGIGEVWAMLPWICIRYANKHQWILGNTFPFVVFTSFGAFWLTYGGA